MTGFVFLDCFERSFWKIIALSVFISRSEWEAHMIQRCQHIRIFWIATQFSVSAKTKIYCLISSTMNSKGFFTHTSEIQKRFRMNAICIWPPTTPRSLNCLADWPRGTMNWPLAAFLFVPPWVAPQRWKSALWRTKGFSLRIKIKVDFEQLFSSRPGSYLGYPLKLDTVNRFIAPPLLFIRLQFKVISRRPDVLPTWSPKIIILG